MISWLFSTWRSFFLNSNFFRENELHKNTILIKIILPSNFHSVLWNFELFFIKNTLQDQKESALCALFVLWGLETLGKIVITVEKSRALRMSTNWKSHYQKVKKNPSKNQSYAHFNYTGCDETLRGTGGGHGAIRPCEKTLLWPHFHMKPKKKNHKKSRPSCLGHPGGGGRGGGTRG